MLLCWLLIVTLTIHNIHSLPQTLPADGTKKEPKVSGKTTVTSGENSKLGRWPWMVGLGYQSVKKPGLNFLCGASLISNKWIVTAANCVHTRSTKNYNLTVARLGAWDLNDNATDKENHKDFSIDEIITHPNFSLNPMVNDIAVVRLKDPVTFTKLIQPISILNKSEHKSDEFYSGKHPIVIGYGATTLGGPVTNKLKEIQIQFTDVKKCAQNYASVLSAVIDQRVLCAGNDGEDACQGDSGGPLMIPVENTYHLAGIVSYGLGCGNPDYPGVYTRVAHYADWITSATGI